MWCKSHILSYVEHLLCMFFSSWAWAMTSPLKHVGLYLLFGSSCITWLWEIISLGRFELSCITWLCEIISIERDLFQVQLEPASLCFMLPEQSHDFVTDKQRNNTLFRSFEHTYFKSWGYKIKVHQQLQILFIHHYPSSREINQTKYCTYWQKYNTWWNIINETVNLGLYVTKHVF